MSKKVSSKEEAFALAFFEERNGRKAWMKAFPNSKCTDSSADTLASRMLNKVEVQELLFELDRKAESTVIMSKKERMEWLSKVVVTPVGEVHEGSDLCQEYKEDERGNRSYKMPSKLGAIAELNKMDGAYAPQKHEVEGLAEIAGLIASLPSCPLVKNDEKNITN